MGVGCGGGGTGGSSAAMPVSPPGFWLVGWVEVWTGAALGGGTRSGVASGKVSSGGGASSWDWGSTKLGQGGEED